MLQLSRINLVGIFTLVLLAFCGSAEAEILQGEVIGITDGDTVTVLDSNKTAWKVRLMGIDAPEKNQPFGKKSKEALSDLIFGKMVFVEYHKRDRFGRAIGKIVVDGVDANLEQVKAGLAWHYKQYQKEQSSEDREVYSRAEEQARADQKGLWADSAPVPPWEWRHMRKPRA